ncbi:hypothetical protein [Longispora fulva]|uniref:Ubiquinone biosynthesis protein UbiJ n=1 Tax=Longispora fulva TaxID=619741 RepID=A0A8J7GJR0_9ACTN|nr:hypothetical protein [Longispora fulva]MBG6140694.1 ubiquinone biosynthesis protein UbiJ [Longispora fulva]
MRAADLVLALLGTGVVSSIVGALLGRRARDAEVAKLYAERDVLRAQAAHAITEAAAAVADELRTELARLSDELADARTEIARLRAVIDTLTSKENPTP